MRLSNLELSGPFHLIFIILALRTVFPLFGLVSLSEGANDESICKRHHSRVVQRYVTFVESYKKRSWGFWKKKATKLSSRWEPTTEWYTVEECCLGYVAQSQKPLRCIPTCSSGCQHGKCSRPNVCTCDAGFRVTMIHGSSHCLPDCGEYGDNNGGCGAHAHCIAPKECQCETGYTPTVKRIHPDDAPTYVLPCIPKCTPACDDNAYCHAPNKCQCNVGYRSDSSNVTACIPVCKNACESGFCVSPNKCTCLPGFMQSPTEEFVCQPICDNECIHANCIEPNYCECHQGYQKHPEEPPYLCSPICNTPCVNADCTRPNHCECHDGYKLNDNITMGLCSPICHPSCVNADCTKPNHCECHAGYKIASKDRPHVCLAICDPPCINGTCEQPNHCECHSGYSKYSTTALQLCSPICNPACGSNAYCDLPNKCACDFGYAVGFAIDSNFTGNGQSPNHIMNWTDSTRYTADTAVIENIACRPLCEPECPKNGNCIAPNVCQCDVGYRSDSRPDRKTSESECIPICMKDCVNGFCGYPNKCTCLPGYKPSLSDDFVCEPFCQYDCINSRCTHPDHCECMDGYKKAKLELADTYETFKISDNLCIPIYSELCVNATCVAPNTCLCSPGYVLNNASADLSEQFCEPLCEPNCSIEMECVAPNKCQSINNDKLSKNLSYVTNITENCSYINENGTCVCKFGWTGLRCDEPLFCAVTFVSNYLTEQLLSILNSNFSVVNNTTEYNESYYENIEELDWQGQPCRETCRISILSEETSVNISHDVIQCRRLELINDDNDVISADNTSISKEGENRTTVCFIKVESECNRLEIELCGFELKIYVIAGVSLLAIVTVFGMAMYFAYRKRRTIIDKSRSNSTLSDWPESTPTTRILDTSSL